MASTIQEPDLFNDVEIMEISDFNTENDENYVSVELLSDNDEDDETDDVTLDTIPFCPPKDLLGENTESATDSDQSPSQPEQDRYEMASTPQHRFLSDHQYLVGSSMHHIVPPEACDDQIAMRVPHSSERFSVSYDMDIRTQDLFNKESQNTGESACHGHVANVEETNNNIAAEDSLIECKIEIGETEFQEDYRNLECVSHEEIMEDGTTDDSEDDVVDLDRLNTIILDCIPRVEMKENHELRSLENDHSYTSYSDHIFPRPAIRDRNADVAELVTLSHKLAKERDVTSADAKQIVVQIEQAVKSFRKRQQGLSDVLDSDSQTVPEETRSDSESLSVVLSTNCSERLENEGIISSSGGSVPDTNNENGNDDSGTDTDCTAQRTNDCSSGKEVAEPDLDQLLSLGDCFAKQCEKWLAKRSVEIDKACAEPAKYTRLLTMFETLKSQLLSVSAPREDHLPKETTTKRVEIAVQTVGCCTPSQREQRTLNEKCKKKMLASASDSSSLSDSDDSSRTANSDSENMMGDFVRRKRLLNKRAKSRLGSDSANESAARVGGQRSKQIYTDSSSDGELDGEKRSAAKDRDERLETDDNLLEDVLPSADDIMLDVHDILPVAEDVVQDYLEKEEVRHKNQTKEGADESVAVKNLAEMTESELQEYNEAQEEKEIDRLCNINYLSVGRCANTPVVSAAGNSNAAKAKELQQKKKKAQNTMEDFLNDGNSDTTIPLVPSDHSDGSDKEAVDTEEQFLQKCNENMKYQLLNQLSSSSSSISSDEDGLKELSRGTDERENNDSNDDDSDASSDSICDSFLKRLERKAANRSKRNKEEKDLENKLQNGVATGATAPEHHPEDGVVEPVQPDGPGDKTVADDSAAKDDAEAQKPKAAGRPEKVELADPKDRALFSRDVFKDVDVILGSLSKPVTNRPSKVKRCKRKDSPGTSDLSSDSDAEGDETSSDSDVELLNESPKNRKRSRIPSLTQEPFDYNDPLLSNKTPRKDSLSSSSGTPGAGSVASGKVEQPISQSSSTKATVTATGISPAGGESSSSAAPTSKNKSAARDEQDCISLSSESDAETEMITGDLDDSSSRAPQENKRKIRAMLTNDELAEETKKAQKEEEGRVARLKKKNEMLKKMLPNFRPREGESELVLDYDSNRAEAICVHPDIVKLLKPHQIEGIKFMYDNTYGSVDALPKHPGSGCILAHCMGLGKTLQMIALLHTVMRYPQLMTRRMLVICPKSTVMNWKEEIDRWQGTIRTGHQMRVYCFADVCTQADKISVLKKWFSCAAPNCAVMLIGYEAFRALINYERRKRSVELPRSSKLERIKEYLLNPGADLVICDEGHQIKNKRSAISEAVSKIKTKRRIMLTGTPIQNNLKEYYCMVNFIKPSFLGSDKEFSNLYANPIKNGQCKDSDQRAIKIMKQRSYRKEAAVLKEFLPEKYEYVLFVPLTPVQEKMYEVFLQMNEYTSTGDVGGEPARTKKFKLIADYTSLRKIWTHPKVLEKAWETANLEKNRRDAARKTATPDSYDESPDDNNDIASGQLSVTNDWWRRYLDVADLESLVPSNKLWIMFEILKHCNDRGEKCLIFSAFVAVLNVVEHFMAKIHNQGADQLQSEAFAYNNFKGPWEPRKDYYRLDGKTHKSDRHRMITSFNDPRNTRTKCFLISAKAGGQGINLTGANRVIILDTSWNPSNDQQNIFRIFRLGQKRKCYVYRLLAMGTMEEKVYSRSVTKQALSFRVVDEQQIDRHYSYGELAELYTLTKVSEMRRETPILPADDILCLLLRLFPDKIFKYHEHDSLLENKPEQDLSEEEKKEAWSAYEREIQTNENRSLISAAWGSVSQAGLFNQSVGPYGRMMDFWNSLAFPGMGGPSLGTSGGDMYRTDFSYNHSLYNAYTQQQQQQQYSMLSDPSYSSLLSKSYGGYPLPGAGGLDFAGSSMLNGQPSGSMGGLGGGTGKPYDPTAALANFFNLYPSKPSTASGSVVGLPNQSTLPPPSSSSPLGAAPPYNGVNSSAAASAHFNALKHMSDYNALSSALHNSAQQQSSGLTISSVASLAQHHKSTGSATGAGQSSNNSGGGIGSSNASMLSILSEQAQLAAAAAYGSPGVSSSPFSPRSVPLLPPTIETQMRNFMGTSSKTTQPPKTASPKTQSQATSSSGSSTATTSSSSSTARNTPGTVTTTAASISTPIISSVMSMAPHGTSINLDPPNRRPADGGVVHQTGANKNNADRGNKTHTTPASALPPSTMVSLGASVNRAATPTAVRTSNSSPTIIPSDDEDEEVVTNKKSAAAAPPHATVRNGGAGRTKDSRDTSAATRNNNTGIAYGAGSPKTTTAPKPSTGMKDLLKHAKSLTNLAQSKSPVRKASSPSVGAGTPISQTPPPIITSPNARPFQSFVRSNSTSPLTSFGTNLQSQSLGKGAPKGNRQSPLAAKLIPPASKTVQQQQQHQQQQILKPLSIPAPRGPASSITQQQQKPLSTPKGTISGTPGFTGLKSPPDRPAVSKGVAPLSKPPMPMTSVITTRQPPPTPVAGNVTKTLQKSAPDAPGPLSKASHGLSSAVGKPLPSGTNVTTSVTASGLTVTKTNVVVNSSNGARISTKPPSNESRPITLSLTPLQAGSGATVGAASKVNKKVVPLLPKGAAQSNSPTTVASVSQSNRSSPVGMRPIGAVQKPPVSSQTKVGTTPVAMFPGTVLSSPAGLNRMASPVGGTVSKTIVTPNLKPNPIRVPTAATASSPTVVNRLAKGGATAPKPNVASNGALATITRTTVPSASVFTGSPALSAFASRPHLTVGTTTMTTIPVQNIAPKPTPISNSVTVTNTPNSLSYSIKNVNKNGGVVITKAVASPTIRQISAPQGGPHAVVKSSTGTPQHTTTVKASTPVNVGASTVRQVVPTLGLTRTGNPATSSTTFPVGHFQPGGTNNVFIRKRKSDAPQLPSKQSSIEPTGPAKRVKVDENV
uniref:Transcriptional regulator ATRX n=1 Tax=Anopheles atroparvus TaxID=41427 RepID=A0A182IJF5_ANOAO